MRDGAIHIVSFPKGERGVALGGNQGRGLSETETR